MIARTDGGFPGVFVLPEEEKYRITSFFPHSLPSRVWLDAYFESRVPGVAYVDSLSAPTIAFVVTEFHHIAFVGWLDQATDFTHQLQYVLSQEVYLGLVRPSTTDFEFPKQNLTGKFARYEFKAYSPTNGSAHGTGGTVSFIDFLPLSRSNFARCESKHECLDAYETRERFLQECFGIVGEQDGAYVGNAEVICQSHGQDGRLWADLQIVVSEPFRRKGVGLSLARKLIDQMLSRNIRPIWSCNKDNVASEALARKLGFSDMNEFEILNYEIRPGLQKYWVETLKAMGTSIETKVPVVQRLQEQFLFNRMDAHWLVVTYLRETEGPLAE